MLHKLCICYNHRIILIRQIFQVHTIGTNTTPPPPPNKHKNLLLLSLNISVLSPLKIKNCISHFQINQHLAIQELFLYQSNLSTYKTASGKRISKGSCLQLAQSSQFYEQPNTGINKPSQLYQLFELCNTAPG